MQSTDWCSSSSENTNTSFPLQFFSRCCAEINFFNELSFFHWIFFGIWYVIISSPMVIFISYRKTSLPPKHPLWEQLASSVKTPVKYVLGAKALQSCVGKVTHTHTPTHCPGSICSEMIYMSQSTSASRPQQFMYKADIQANICFFCQTGSLQQKVLEELIKLQLQLSLNQN